MQVRLVRMNGVPSFDSKRHPGTSASNCTIAGSLHGVSAARIAASIATEQLDFMVTSVVQHVCFLNLGYRHRLAGRTASQKRKPVVESTVSRAYHELRADIPLAWDSQHHHQGDCLIGRKTCCDWDNTFD
jgi:hypothetical protein